MDKNNKIFSINSTEFDSLKIINVFKNSDERGSFVKEYGKYIQENLNFNIKEVFYTYSHKNVIRANHFQIIDKQQKIISCLKGKILDFVVDLRPNSATYKKTFKIFLSGDDNIEIFIPYGFSHGYIVLEDSIVSYKCDQYFNEEGDLGFKWNDPIVDVDFSEIDNVILSERDKSLPSFEEIEKKLIKWFS